MNATDSGVKISLYCAANLAIMSVPGVCITNITHLTTEQIIQILISLSPFIKYGAFFGLVMIEGPIVSMISGLLAAQGIMTLWIVYLVSVIGDLSSDSIYYILGRLGNKTLISSKYTNELKENPSRAEKLKKLFHEHPGKTLVLGKLTHIVGVPVLIAAGSVKIPATKFIIYDLSATLIKSFIFIMLGYYAGTLIGPVNKILEYATAAALLLTGLTLLYFFLGRYFEKKLF